MIKLVAFDWNGTLLADTHMNVRVSNLDFKYYGMKPISLKRFRETFHIPISSFWKANGGDEKDLANQSLKFHELYEANVGKIRTRSGTKEVLAWIKNREIKSLIFSNHITPDITKQLIRLNIFEYFQEVLARPIGEHSHVHSRSKDDKLNDYVLNNKLKPSEVIVVGDTEEETEIGQQYGYHTVAITGGYNSTRRLKKHHPDFLIHNLKDLIPIIKKLNQK